MATFFITGASRGLGLELTKQLLQSPASQVAQVFASSRSEASGALQDLITNNPDRAHHVIAAIDDAESVQKAAKEVQDTLGSRGLDVLINNAGITASNEGGISGMSTELLTSVLDVNLLGTHRTTCAFLPLLEKGEQKKIINLSTAVGSVTWATRFQHLPNPAYKISKTALNMLTTQYALGLAQKGFTCFMISPGWLKTDLGGAAWADLEVDVGAREAKKLILECSPLQNGKLLNIHVPGWEESPGQYDGGEIPW